MGRKPNDGRGKLGGRAKGTPNANKPLKAFLREHSERYFAPTITEVDENGVPTGRIISQYEEDMKGMKPSERANAELTLLKFHTPQMQATAVDMNVTNANKTLSERLSNLADGAEIASESE